MDEEDFFMFSEHLGQISEGIDHNFENLLHIGLMGELGCDARVRLNEDIRAIDCLFDIRGSAERTAAAMDRIADVLEYKFGPKPKLPAPPVREP